MVTAPYRSAPSIGGLARTRSTSSWSGPNAVPENTPARIAPRSRRCRTTARVSIPATPTTPWPVSASASERRDRQLDGVRDGSRTA